MLGSHAVSAQVQCVPGMECQTFKVSYDNKTEYGIAPSASSVQFYDTQATKDQICTVKGYQFNPGAVWARTYNQWSTRNGNEYYAKWEGGKWVIEKASAVSYLDTIICARTPVPVSPSVTISTNPSVVSFGDKTTISWSSQNTTSCSASGDWSGTKAVSGSEESSAFYVGGKTFTITCSSTSGETTSATAKADIDYIPSSPKAFWVSIPSSPVAPGTSYTVAIGGSDPDNDVEHVYIQRDGVNWADGVTSASKIVSDNGPQRIVYSGWAVDSRGKVSNIISGAVEIAAPPVSGPSSPSIRWISAPSNAGSDQRYHVEVEAKDPNGDLDKVNIDKDGSPFAYAGRGDGTVGTSGNDTSDTGPKSVTFTAWATDTQGHSSPKISNTVSISAPPQAVSASVSASPSCVAPGGTISVSGNASGSVSSNALEKDSNQDGVYGSIASRSDAGATSASVTVPSSETSSRYDFRVNVNNGASYSSVASVTISSSCGGAALPWYCATMPFLCGGSTGQPSAPSAPSVSISSNASCVAPNTMVTLTSVVNGSPINSNVIQKDSPASGSQYGDGVFGTVADYGSSGGSHNYQVVIGSEGYYDFKALVNNSIQATTRVRSFSGCASNPINTNPGSPTGGPGGGGGAAPLVCTGGKINVGGSCTCPNGTVDRGGICVAPDFTAGATPSSVIMQVIPEVGGTSRPTSLSIGPSGGYSQPITFTAALSTGWKTVEYSWNGGAFSTNPSYTVQSFSGNYPSVSLAVRVTGTLPSGNQQLSMTARGADGKNHPFTITLQVNKTDPSFIEQ